MLDIAKRLIAGDAHILADRRRVRQALRRARAGYGEGHRHASTRTTDHGPGPDSVDALCGILAGAGTIVWNGPLGVFEFPHFAAGTEKLARAIAASDAFSIAGGGDTLAAIAKFGVANGLSYISTAGGAFLEFLEGKTLPAIAVLEARAAQG